MQYLYEDKLHTHVLLYFVFLFYDKIGLTLILKYKFIILEIKYYMKCIANKILNLLSILIF